TWTLTATDANGCNVGQVFNITQTTPISLNAASQTNVSCNGGTNGAASAISASGGAGGFAYNWTPGNPSGDGTVSVTGLSAGTWTLTATDANGCTKTLTFSVTQPTAVTSSIASQTNVSCNGLSNGAATITAGGGTPSYSYSWAPSGGTAATATGLSAGNYTCTITDANSCNKTQTVIITQPTALTSSVSSQINVSCNGSSNGSATITAGGGTPGYTYSWAPSGGTNATATGLAAGNYTCTITDANACTKTQTVIITQPTAISSSIASQTNVSCNGGSNGAASVSASGGVPGYTYHWSYFGVTTQSISNVPAALYTCTITDAYGCTQTQTVAITEPSALISSVTSQTNVSCSGGANGSATIAASGGTPSYSYAWAPSGGTNATASGLAAGTYTCTITDASACTTTQSLVITAPSAINLLVTSQTNVSCFGSSDGSASVLATDGTPGYSYAWAPSGGTSASATGLTAGNYTCTVTDANSCTKTETVTINEPSAILPSVVSITDALCNGDANGEATIAASGGTPNYSYSWAPSGGTNTTATGLAAGSYTCTITDANACTSIQIVNIMQPAALSATLSSQVDVVCNGAADGEAGVSVNGGTPNYSYAWSPSGGTGAIASGLAGGTYTCTISDVNGCNVSATALIAEPDALTINATLSSDVTCNGFSDGVAQVGVIGGITPYNYSWSTGISTSAVESNLSGGVYTCTVTDDNGCSVSASITIAEPQILLANISSQTNLLCNADASGAATVSATGGTGAYSFLWSPNGATTSAVIGLDAGVYQCVVEDANSCSALATVTITQPDAVLITSLSLTDVSCFGGSDGTATAVAIGGTGALTASSTTLGGQPVNNAALAAGGYFISVSDANGCSDFTTFIINEPPNGMTISTTSTDASCVPGSDGTASATVIGATGAVSYSWSPSGGSASTANGLTPGIYVVQVTDANSCTASESVFVNTSAPFIIGSTSTDATAYGAADGTASITVAGGSSSYTYVWLPTGGTMASASGLAAGTYTATATDDVSGCTVSTTITITEPPATIILTLGANDLDVCNKQSVTMWATSNVPLSSIAWSTGATTDTAMIAPTADGTYTVTATHASGSTASATITILAGTPSFLALVDLFDGSSIVGSTCATLTQGNGLDVSYTDGDCLIIGGIATGSGTSLGNVDACVEYVSAAPTYLGAPYVQRFYTLTPQVQGPATVTLYFTTNDLTEYNANILTNSLPYDTFALPTPPFTASSTISDVFIHKFTDGGIGIGTYETMIATQLTYNPIVEAWEAVFPVTGFSTFYLGSASSPLSSVSINLTATVTGNSVALKWTDAQQQQGNEQYQIVRTESNTGISKTIADNISVTSFVDETPSAGTYQYVVNKFTNGSKLTSNVASVIVGKPAAFIVYPNPSTNVINAHWLKTDFAHGYLQIVDSRGTTVATKAIDKSATSVSIPCDKLSAGVYNVLVVLDGKVMNAKVLVSK
ncbi:MAG: hypothetical protein RL660_363, partial [Bacteroidota bacterium]